MNYKQDNVVGTTWTRCRAIVISNPLPGKGDKDIVTGVTKGPSCSFNEEIVLSINNEVQTINSGAFSVDFNPDNIITLIDTNTGSNTGETITHAKLYQIFYSLYMENALKRDNTQETT